MREGKPRGTASRVNQTPAPPAKGEIRARSSDEAEFPLPRGRFPGAAARPARKARPPPAPTVFATRARTAQCAPPAARLLTAAIYGAFTRRPIERAGVAGQRGNVLINEQWLKPDAARFNAARAPRRDLA